MFKIFSSYIMIGVFLTASIFAFADTTSQAPNNKFSAKILFSQGVDCYKHKNYIQAKFLFGELAKLHDRRAEVWLKKVDRAVFLAEQLKVKRELLFMAEEMKRHKEQERQAKLRAEAETKIQKNKERVDRSVQLQDRNKEVSRRKAQEREEKKKHEEFERQEAQRVNEMERQERQRQSELETRREVVRKQLEEGVEAMYQNALSLYKQGSYLAAANRFKDLQEIYPGYKRSEQYMEGARRRSLSVAAPATVDALPTQPQQERISQALDLFDPNAQ